MTFRLNIQNLEQELSMLESSRLSEAEQYLRDLRRTDVLGVGDLSGAVAGSNREIAAMAMRRARGQGASVSRVATQNALASAGPVQGTGSAAGDLAAIRQGAGQRMDIATRGAEAQAQESAQAFGTGMDMMAVQRGIDVARAQKQRELALQIASIQQNAETQALRRAADVKRAEMGIDTQQYMTDIQNRDALARTVTGGIITAAGTVVAASGKKSTGATQGTPQSARASSIRTSTPNTVPGSLA